MTDRTKPHKIFCHQNCKFSIGAQCLDDFPVHTAKEFAFIGRSNVGKSSLINALFRSTKLARVSKQPGCTQQVNFFAVGDDLFSVVDLPGYGYATAPNTSIAHWHEMIWYYLTKRQNLEKLWLLIDARRGVLKCDAELMSAMSRCGVAFHVILSKTDKLSTKEVYEVHRDTVLACKCYPSMYNGVVVSSSKLGIGIDEIRGYMMVHAGLQM